MTSDSKPDLIIRAGRIYCSTSGWDGPGEVVVKGDRIVALRDASDADADTVVDFPDCLVLPGLVDFHAHPARGGSRFGVDPDIEFLTRGVTTVMSQGDAGANNWDTYRKDVIEASKIRVLMAINLSASGESNEAGCFQNMEDVDVDACVRTIEDDGESIWGIAMNTAPVCCGDNDSIEIFHRGREAAERTGKPLLVAPRQLDLLRAGDVVTYCFKANADCIVEGGRVRDEVWAARERGVLFDIGHGMASFNFDVAETAIAEGFLPDTISTDQYRRHVGVVPQHDLPRTMSKLIAAGMSEGDVLSRVTERPAELLGLDAEVGSLKPGVCADMTVLRWNDNVLPLCDVDGNARPGGCWEAAAVFRAGELVT